jgi:hypothetical protein
VSSGKEERADLVEREAELFGEDDQCETLDRFLSVHAAVADPLLGRDEAALFVIAHGRGAQSDAASELSDLHCNNSHTGIDLKLA